MKDNIKFYGMITTSDNNVLIAPIDEALMKTFRSLEDQVKRGVSESLEVCIPISKTSFTSVKDKSINPPFEIGVARITSSGISFECGDSRTYDAVSCQEMTKELRLSSSSLVLHNI